MNPRSQARWAIGTLRVLPPYHASQIEVGSIRLNGAVPAAGVIGSRHGKSGELRVKFSWPLVTRRSTVLRQLDHRSSIAVCT